MVKILRIIPITLFICAFFIISIDIYFIFTLRKLPTKLSSSSKISSFIQKKNIYNFNKILSKFYQKEQDNTKSLVTLPSPPILKGIFWEEKYPLALLDFKGKKFWVKKGEKIKGWIVENISPRSVTLKFGKQKVILSLFKEKGNLMGVFNSAASPNPQGIFVVSKEKFNRLISNIGSLFTQIGLKPYLIGGKTEGMKVVYVAPGSIFEKAGLRKGDIILTFNDIPVLTPEDVYKVFEILKTSSFLNVKIKRSGKIITLRAEVR